MCRLRSRASPIDDLRFEHDEGLELPVRVCVSP